ncbi:VOC family protein [candidate division KSB1 bacterium]
MGNPFCHFELNSNDPEKAKEFYKTLFDWNYEDYPMGNESYTIIKTGKEPAGAIFKNPVPHVPSHWLTYVSVDDIDETAAQAEELGAKILKEITAVPEMGKFCVFQDPTGAVLALWQDAKKE